MVFSHLLGTDFLHRREKKKKKNQTLNIQAECMFAFPPISLLLSVQLLSMAVTTSAIVCKVLL